MVSTSSGSHSERPCAVFASAVCGAKVDATAADPVHITCKARLAAKWKVQLGPLSSTITWLLSVSSRLLRASQDLATSDDRRRARMPTGRAAVETHGSRCSSRPRNVATQQPCAATADTPAGNQLDGCRGC